MIAQSCTSTYIRRACVLAPRLYPPMGFWLVVLCAYAALALLCLATPLLQRKFKPLALLAIGVLTPLFYVTIALDRYVFTKRNPLLPFPRNEHEIRAAPAAFFSLLQRSKVSGIPAGAVFVSLTSAGGMDDEPGKARSAMKLRVQWREAGDGPVGHMDVFVKVPAERNVGPALQAFTSVFAPESREVGHCSPCFSSPFPPPSLCAAHPHCPSPLIILLRAIERECDCGVACRWACTLVSPPAP